MKCSRVARARAQELDASALYAAGVTSRALRIGSVAVFLGDLAIIARVAVDEDTYHAELLGALDLETSKDASIPGNGNLSLEVNASLDQVCKVSVRSIVDIDKGAGDIAAGRVAVERRDLVLGSSGGVFFKNVLGQRSLECNVPGSGVARLFQQGDAVVDRVVDVDIIGDNAGLDAPFLPSVLGPFGLELLASVCTEWLCIYQIRLLNPWSRLEFDLLTRDKLPRRTCE